MDGTGLPTRKCCVTVRVGALVDVNGTAVAATAGRVAIPVRVAGGRRVGVTVAVGRKVGVKVAVGVAVSVGTGVKVDVGVKVADGANAMLSTVGAAMRLKTRPPRRHPNTTPTAIAIISCRRDSCVKSTSGDYNIG